jgi:hypothetical protein
MSLHIQIEIMDVRNISSLRYSEEIDLGTKFWKDFFNLKREEVTRRWRRLHNERLHLYSSSNVISIITEGRRDRKTCRHHDWKS